MYVILREKVNNVKERQGTIRNDNEVSSIPQRETALRIIRSAVIIHCVLLPVFIPDFIQVAVQGILHGGHRREAGFNELGAVQTGVERPLCGGGILGRGNRDHLAGEAGFFHDHLRKVIPGKITLVADVINAVFFRGQHIADHAGEIPGIGGRADLVIDHADLFLFLTQVQHSSKIRFM